LENVVLEIDGGEGSDSFQANNISSDKVVGNIDALEKTQIFKVGKNPSQVIGGQVYLDYVSSGITNDSKSEAINNIFPIVVLNPI